MVEGDKENKANNDAGRRATLVLGRQNIPPARPPAPVACLGRGSIDAPLGSLAVDVFDCSLPLSLSYDSLILVAWFPVSKYPTPGSSKTRLIPALGEVLAAQLAMAMLQDLLRRFSIEVSETSTRRFFLTEAIGLAPVYRVDSAGSFHERVLHFPV